MAKKDYEKCQIATPIEYVKFMLEVAEYNGNVYDYKLLENSCGEGNILCEIVKIFIVEGLKKLTIEEIKARIEKNICGIELDEKKISKCKENLNKIAADYNLLDVNWNILNIDFLSYDVKDEYDYIIGNPPYISYKNLSIKNRTTCREKFVSCKKGKFDYCYAFIEKSISHLSSNGKFVYLIPSSIFKNVFANDLRAVLLEDIKAIYDNFKGKVFIGASVSPSIFLYQKGCKIDNIEYCTCNTADLTFDKTLFSKRELGKKWVFSKDANSSNKKVRFGDVYTIGNSIATLSNECFLIKNPLEKNGYIEIDDHKVEIGLVKNAVSPNSMTNNISYKIIYPYEYDNKGNLVKYSNEEFKQKYPFGYKYLQTKKDKLDERTSDENAKWFEYGRSQALKNMNKEKLMISIMVTNKVNVFELNHETIPYSGIYIIQKEDNYSLEYAKSILESDSFLKYICSIGISSEGESKRITCNDVKNYKF